MKVEPLAKAGWCQCPFSRVERTRFLREFQIWPWSLSALKIARENAASIRTISSCLALCYVFLSAHLPLSMDTISRENNSMLPMGAIIVGVIALLLGGYSAITLSKVNKTVAEQEAKLAKIETLETSVNNAASATDQLRKQFNDLRGQTQAGFDQVGPLLGQLKESVTKLEEATKKPTPAAKSDKKGGEPVVAGPGEYIVKPGDTGVKIANANGVAVKDLQAVNPGVNFSSIKPGQKLKLPAKK
jgi:LysM repeat protein